MNINGKRLLVLGCGNNAPDIRSFGDKYGMTIVVAGKAFTEEIQAIADEIYVVDILECEALAGLIKAKNIDGVFVGGNENVISVAIDVTEKLGLPFYSSRQLWDSVMNKRLFKQACRKYGVPTMKDYKIHEESLEEDAQKLQYPVVIKSVDNCGSAGVMKCERSEDFAELYQFAKDHSRAGQVTVGEFNDGFEIVVCYTFINGKVTISSMADKYVRSNSESFIPLAEIYAYPS